MTNISDPQYAAYVDEALTEYLAPGATLPAGLASSTHYDIKLIAWHVFYWCGSNSRIAISPSRGHYYTLSFVHTGCTYKIRIDDYKNHRVGVVGMRAA